ncbi:OmpA family protein [Pseudooceanicola nanhaiensis]|uniref:OmpA family protein n=1 Tax=Pseudooceanicola nanhaiensis TaxID=375761 RepID=UPI001CD590FA|nr:OmpA family protein [Pseudooceanicola nanhaiensis]MCA0920998.1 OmpA family protein [Pseudooceanicola nanhaiensis]
MKTFLKSTTALILSGALILPGPLAAQSGGREDNNSAAQREQFLKKKEQEAQKEQAQKQQAQKQQGQKQQGQQQAKGQGNEKPKENRGQQQAGQNPNPPGPNQNANERAKEQAQNRERQQDEQRRQQAEREAEQNRQQAQRDADQQRQQQAERETEQKRQQQAQREAEQQRQQQAQREAEQQRQQQAQREAEQQRQQQAQRDEELRKAQQRAEVGGREGNNSADQRAQFLENQQREEQRQQAERTNSDDRNLRQALEDERNRDQTRDRAAARDSEEPRRPDAAAQARRAARDAEENRRPLAAANPRNEGRMVEQRITEDNFRSSREDFRTDLRGERRANADDDSGLSNFEKLALFGLGAVAVGSLLNNGDEVVSNTGDRVVVERDGEYRVLKDDDVLLRQPGTDVRTYAFDDGSTRTVALREDGTQVETLRAPDGRVLRRTRILPDGREVLLFDDTQQVAAVDVSDLPQTRAQEIDVADADEMRLRRALEAELGNDVNRRFSLSQVRDISAVRALVPEIEVDTITFDTGSAAIPPEQARRLADLGIAMREAIDDNPAEVFLIEGHTDAVGAASMNLALSDRRAETLALALTEYFDVPPENMVVQGYGESDLKVLTASAERDNRRAAVRRITPLLDGSNGS